jgi:hypothetical protein
MKPPVEHGDDIFINNSDEQELADRAGLGPERARRLVEHRPFHSWDDVNRLEGFTAVVVDALKQAGAQLGEPDPSAAPRISEAHREQEQLAQRAGTDFDEGVLSDHRAGNGPDRRVS